MKPLISKGLVVREPKLNNRSLTYYEDIVKNSQKGRQQKTRGYVYLDEDQNFVFKEFVLEEFDAARNEATQQRDSPEHGPASTLSSLR